MIISCQLVERICKLTHVVAMPQEIQHICANGKGGSGFDEFLQVHRPQLEASNVPQRYWKTLYNKLENEVFDAGGVFTLVPLTEDHTGDDDDEGDEQPDTKPDGWMVVVTAESGINVEDPQHVYLIDHAWTYQVRHSRRHLEVMPGLLQRMAALFDIDTQAMDVNQLIEEVLTQSWRFCQTYQFGNVANDDDENLEPLWYVQDEFGSRIQHSDTPTCRTVPFHHVTTKVTYTLLWPTTSLDMEDELTRDYAEFVTDPLKRKAKLLPWVPHDFSEIDWKQKEFDDSYFQVYTRSETLPDPAAIIQPPTDRKMRVYSDMAQVRTFLTDNRFEIVDQEETADILWTKTSIRDFRDLSQRRPGMFMNQFPCEILITSKDPLAVIARRAYSDDIQDPDGLHSNPKWLPITYNLQLELPQFVSYYQHRDKLGADNHWILKPWNMARGLDMHISADLVQILRLQQTGPKVACKYIEDPVLFMREEVGLVKFDIRYIVLLASTQPLKLYAYRVFWLRFANKPYSLDHFDDYEKHFTVMNYQAAAPLKQVHYDQFIPMFDRQFPQYPWDTVESKIFNMFKELFSSAVSRPHPQGMPSAPQSRAIYAIDLMLKWDTNTKGERVIQPMLCEVNFSPDCERACKYHPHFYNDIYSTLFLDDATDKNVKLL